MTKTTASVSVIRKLIFTLPLLTLLVLGAANIAFSGQLVNQGEQIHALEADTTKLALYEKDLDTKLAGLQSLQNIKNDAIAQGYIPVTSAAYVDGARPVALR